MNDRDELLERFMSTDLGRDLLYALASNVPDIVFALRTDAEAHKKIPWKTRYDELMGLSKEICRLAQASGLVGDL